jgi:hypothetical protein
MNTLEIRHYSLLAFLCLCTSAHAAKELLLRTAPEADAPIIAKVTASDKVILDAAPAPTNAAAGWRQLALPSPFEGYVPNAAMAKNFDIVVGTPVHYLPTANAAEITRVEPGDSYEVVRVNEDWATVRFRKDITGYFIDETAEDVAIDFQALQPSPQEDRSATERTQTAQTPRTAIAPAPSLRSAPAPVAIPAPRTRINPDAPISQLDPNSLPPENVTWRPARLRGSESAGQSESVPEPARHTVAPQSVGGIIVPSSQTQAREAAPEFGPAKTPRLLTGILKQELAHDGSAYPIRLLSPDGRRIAYVDLSGIYIPEIKPYLNEKVYIRGQIHPLPESSAQLVILAESLRLAN